MSSKDKQLETAVTKTVERMADSKQPAFGGNPAAGEFAGFGTILRWAQDEAPAYEPDTRELDAWLRDFVQREPHLGGVVAQATSLVRNRGWSLTGGRNTVSRAKAMMHDADRQDGAMRGDGYRHYITRLARAFYITNIGAISENGRDAPPRMMNGMVTAGPLRSMWSTDPTRFRLRPYGTKNYPLREYPLAYYPPGSGSKVQYWRHADYFRIVANPSIDDRMMGAGYSAVAMARELAEIMVAVYQHDKEMLGARAPKGLLILQNIDEPMWDAAMRSRKEKLDGLERDYFGGVAVLAQAGIDQADAKLVALSSLPAGFDQREMIDLLMFLYALVFGYSPDEFWPVAGGSFGRGTEAQIGMERATRKGDMDFFSAFQERLQAELPATVMLEYEERDDSGRRVEAEIDKVHADVAAQLYEAGGSAGERLWTREMALSYLIERGIGDPSYTDVAEDMEYSDTDVVRMARLKERLMDTSDQVRAAVAWQKTAIERRNKAGDAYDIVRYMWPSNRLVNLWPASELPHYGKLQRVAKPKKRAVLFEDEDTGLVITDDDVDTAVAEAGSRLGAEFAQVLEAPTREG